MLIRRAVNRRGKGAVSTVSSLVYRVFRFGAHRLSLPAPTSDHLLKRGTAISKQMTRVGNAVFDRIIDRVVSFIGRLLTKPTESVHVMRQVSRLVDTEVVVGVICLDAPSLFQGYLIAKFFRGLPVLTAYPQDWSSEGIQIQRRMAGGVAG
jgi:hypothetical protein